MGLWTGNKRLNRNSKADHKHLQVGGGRVATPESLFVFVFVVAVGDDAADDGGVLHAAGRDGAPGEGRQGPRLLHAQTAGERALDLGI